MRTLIRLAVWLAIIIVGAVVWGAVLVGAGNGLARLFHRPEEAQNIVVLISVVVLIVISEIQAHALRRERDAARDEFERTREQLLACSDAALGRLPAGISPHYLSWSAPLADVLRMRKELERTRAAYADECERSSQLRNELARAHGLRA